MKKTCGFIIVLFLFVGGLIWTTNTHAFADVPPDSQFKSAYQHLNDIGVMSGFADGTFKPLNTVSRIEGLAIAMKAAGIYPYDADISHFNDVFEQWHKNFTTEAVNRGILIPSGNFNPQETITKAQFMQWLTAFSRINLQSYKADTHYLSYDIDATSPYALAFAYAKKYHIVHLHPDGEFKYLDALNRHQVAMYTHRHLKVIKSNYSQKSALKMEASLENFLSAIEGERYAEAEHYALSIRDYTKKVLVSQNSEETISADALGKAVEHFIEALRALKHENFTKGSSELLLALKQSRRAQESGTSLNKFAKNFEGIIIGAIKKMGEDS